MPDNGFPVTFQDPEALAASPEVQALIAAARREGVSAGLVTAMGLIASIGYGKNEDVDQGHEEAFRAIETHKRELEAAAIRALKKGE